MESKKDNPTPAEYLWQFMTEKQSFNETFLNKNLKGKALARCDLGEVHSTFIKFLASLTTRLNTNTINNTIDHNTLITHTLSLGFTLTPPEVWPKTLKDNNLTLKIPQKFNDQWQDVEYEIELIPLTPTHWFKCYLLGLKPEDRLFAYGLVSQDTTHQPHNFLIFSGTRFRNRYGKWTSIFADLFIWDVGDILYWSGEKRLTEFINNNSKNNQIVTIAGTSLGGSLTITTANQHTENQCVHAIAINPAGRMFPRSDAEEKTSNLDNKRFKVYTQENDILSRSGGYFPSNKHWDSKLLSNDKPIVTGSGWNIAWQYWRKILGPHSCLMSNWEGTKESDNNQDSKPIGRFVKTALFMYLLRCLTCLLYVIFCGESSRILIASLALCYILMHTHALNNAHIILSYCHNPVLNALIPTLSFSYFVAKITFMLIDNWKNNFRDKEPSSTHRSLQITRTLFTGLSFYLLILLSALSGLQLAPIGLLFCLPLFCKILYSIYNFYAAYLDRNTKSFPAIAKDEQMNVEGSDKLGNNNNAGIKDKTEITQIDDRLQATSYINIKLNYL